MSYMTAHARMTKHISQAAQESILPASAGTPTRAAAMKHDPRSSLFGLPLGIQTTSVLFKGHTSPDGLAGRLSRITSETTV